MSQRIPGFRHACHPCRRQAGSGDRRARHADLPDDAYVFDDVDHAASLFALQAFGNIYTRIMNPTRPCSRAIAALEGGTAALAAASGHARRSRLPRDDAARREFIAAGKLYGGSINQFSHSFKYFGWQVGWADMDDRLDLRKPRSTPRPRRSSSRVDRQSGRRQFADIEAIAKIARKAGVPLIVDNTLATPYLCGRSSMAPTSSSIR